MTIQTTMDGVTWKDLEIAHYPEYPYGVSQGLQLAQGPMYVFTDKPFSAKGVRVSGQVNVSSNYGNGMATYTGLKELEIYTGESLTGTETVNMTGGISLFPNPAKDLLNVNFEKLLFTEYTISDLTGKIVMSNKLEGTSEAIDISNLEKGMYLFTAKGVKSHVQKIVIE